MSACWAVNVPRLGIGSTRLPPARKMTLSVMQARSHCLVHGRHDAVVHGLLHALGDGAPDESRGRAHRDVRDRLVDGIGVRKAVEDALPRSGPAAAAGRWTRLWFGRPAGSAGLRLGVPALLGGALRWRAAGKLAELLLR